MTGVLVSQKKGRSTMKNLTHLPLVLMLMTPAVMATDAIDLQAVVTVDLDQSLGQLRAVPIARGNHAAPAILTIYGQDAEIDPYIGMFFFPESTLRMTLFDDKGHTQWTRDLGPGVVPGIWFCPIYSFDLNQDGTDEIWYVGNADPTHPLDYRTYQLERVDAQNGKTTGTWPWLTRYKTESLSHRYRNFILGGFVKDQAVLVTAQGTYGKMALQAWNPDMSLRWETQFDPKADGGPLGSHVCPVVDIDNDGIDEVLWGERCIELDKGRERFQADRDIWRGHSDIIVPVLDRDHGRWLIHTCRETSTNQSPRIVVFDERGQRLWGKVDEGHIDTGWAARLGPKGQSVVLGVKVGKKIRDAQGERRLWTESHLFEAATGKPFKLPFDPYTSIPVDLNGDGIHELVKGYFEGDGTVLDRTGKILGNVGGLCAMCSKFTKRPGEQILSFSKDGKVRIWADVNAQDRPAALKRYRDRFYYANQRMTACGYNLFTLGGF